MEGVEEEEEGMGGKGRSEEQERNSRGGRVQKNVKLEAPLLHVKMLTSQLKVVFVLAPSQHISQISQLPTSTTTRAPLARDFYPVVSPSSSQLQVVFVTLFLTYPP